MKFLKRKKGKKYPEMVDTIHGDLMEDTFTEEDVEATDEVRDSQDSASEDISERPEGESVSAEPMPEENSEQVQETEGEAQELQNTDEKESQGQEPLENSEQKMPADSEEEQPVQENRSEDSFSFSEGYERPQEEQGGSEEGLMSAPEEDLSERDLARKARMKRRKKEMRRVHFLICFLVLLLLAGCGTACCLILQSQGVEISFSSLAELLPGKSKERIVTVKKEKEQNADEQKGLPENGQGNGTAAGQSEEKKTEKITEKVTEAPVQTVSADVTAQADLMAAQYDYDGAINLLKAQQEYGTDVSAQQKVSGYESAKAACVEISPDTVSHVFVHSLIVDPSRAFDGQDNQQGYNLNMVTLEEFKKIIQSMYDNGYVLVSLHDMGEIDANGKMQRKSIYLPQGKKPIIFSQDDVSYYHSYANDGFADRLIVDENGDVKNEYTDAAGNTTVGDYDMVPVLDTFIKEHPDFSYRGRKGIVVLTGYNGVLGYHTDGDYRDKLSLQEDQAKWLEEHPEFDFDADVAAATKVADAMKASGWEFASHTWGHISVSDVSLEKLQTDTQKWLDYVSPIVGGTDMIIFAFGSDIGDWTGYSSDNEKFNYLKSVGFDYFCNVDGSSLSWVQFGETYLRTGRMNIDGYRMSSNPDILSPLFDVSQVYDYNNRPEMAEWSQ